MRPILQLLVLVWAFECQLGRERHGGIRRWRWRRFFLWAMKVPAGGRFGGLVDERRFSSSSSKEFKLVLLCLLLLVSKLLLFVMLLLFVKQLLSKLNLLLSKLLLKKLLIVRPLVKRRIDISKHFWRLCCSCCLEWGIARGKHHVIMLTLLDRDKARLDAVMRNHWLLLNCLDHWILLCCLDHDTSRIDAGSHRRLLLQMWCRRCLNQIIARWGCSAGSSK
mmetsp:Transcript_33301/g.59994  ORF Transcript_33301/g.59994 Transcript_33301/m.59994 type:complete len:221 (-) Transcript_33301:344-1006(-)